MHETYFKTIQDKVRSNQRLSAEDGIFLFQYQDLLAIGQLAAEVKYRLHGRKVYYNWNLHLNSTNVCEASCLFCSFARLKTGMAEAFTMDMEKAREWITKRYHPGMTEIHIVNGLNPDLDFDYYIKLLKMIKESFPALHIKAFTAVEIHYFAEKYSMSYEDVLKTLSEAGLGSLPGGGAEIFSARVRKKICRDKATAEQWLEVHRTAHKLKIKTNCTMLYGTIEKNEERIDHLVRLRELQDETNGFQVFVPLAFHNDGNRMKNIPPPTAVDDLRVVAISRLMLDNIVNIKAYWVMLGVKTAQTALAFGANDFDGTVTEEKIYHMAGSHSPDTLTVTQIKDLISKAGYEAVERNTTYQEVNSVV